MEIRIILQLVIGGCYVFVWYNYGHLFENIKEWISTDDLAGRYRYIFYSFGRFS